MSDDPTELEVIQSCYIRPEVSDIPTEVEVVQSCYIRPEVSDVPTELEVIQSCYIRPEVSDDPTELEVIQSCYIRPEVSDVPTELQPLSEELFSHLFIHLNMYKVPELVAVLLNISLPTAMQHKHVVITQYKTYMFSVNNDLIQLIGLHR